MNRRLKVRVIREILRYAFDHNLSREAIAGALQTSKGSVTNVLNRFAASGLNWPLAAEISDCALETLLYPPREKNEQAPKPDIDYIRKELGRKHVTLQLLWREYHDQYPHGMSRASFYRYWQAHRQLDPTMAIVHKAGDKLFVDYSGDGPFYIDRRTGEKINAELFVCCQGGSGFSYAEATASQSAPDFVASHVRALAYFGGAPVALVPDNLKSGVKRSDRYEPTLGPLYAKLAEHYGCAVLPARVRKPRDKAMVENAVLSIQRYILGRLRNRVFFSLAALNEAVRVLLNQFNDEPMQSYGGISRRERFYRIDQPALRPLPDTPFKLTSLQLDLRVSQNYHILYEKHHYSVPHALIGQRVDVHQAGGILEIYYQDQHVARHKKAPPDYGYTTAAEHLHPHHEFVKGWSPEFFLGKGSLIGAATRELMQQIIKRYKHPEQAYKTCLGVLNLAKVYPPQRLEAACARALHFQTPTYQSLKAILLQGLDRQPLAHCIPADASSFCHENVRGARYYG